MLCYVACYVMLCSVMLCCYVTLYYVMLWLRPVNPKSQSTNSVCLTGDKVAAPATGQKLPLKPVGRCWGVSSNTEDRFLPNPFHFFTLPYINWHCDNFCKRHGVFWQLKNQWSGKTSQTPYDYVGQVAYYYGTYMSRYELGILLVERVWCFSLTILRQVAGPSGRSPAEIVGSNPTGGMDVCLLWVLCVVR